MRYVCSICGYVYDEAKESAPFSQLPDSWKCPWCKAPKSMFGPEKKEEQEEAVFTAPVPAADEEEMKLSAGEFAALCSNLARGCEKQYRKKEAELFHQLAQYFTASVPAAKEASLGKLGELLEADRKSGYPALNAAADAQKDRGTKRICVWGEKVTNMAASLLLQYQEEGEAFLAGTDVWVCSVCGFIYVGSQPPKLCPVCKVPDWKFEKMEGRGRP